ncbi:MAG: DNA primase [Alphaproteobacteria bacterium]|nr:MAG: DNA primase [Alphaproteobacteria bacterium]
MGGDGRRRTMAYRRNPATDIETNGKNMRFSPRFLDELRERISLADLVGRRVKLQRAGREWKGLCPFHQEKTPSFHVVEDKNFYHCFGCGAHGDAIRWLEETEGMSFPEAVEELARHAGMPLPKRDPETARRERDAEDHRGRLLAAMEAATRFYQQQLGSSEGASARDYLKARGVTAESVLEFRLGFAPGGARRDRLAAALAAQGFDTDTLVDAGLLIRPRKAEGRAPFDRFRERLIFPIGDARGRIIAFGGRALDDHPAKYLNSPETPLFHKGEGLYRYREARAAARDGNILVVEGYMDVIALAQAGFPQAVAPLGTALSEAQLALLWRAAAEPLLCFDGDAAGLKAADRAIERALPLLAAGRSLRFVLLPGGMDPDDLIRREGANAFARLIESALPLIDMLWRLMVENADTSTPERRAAVEQAVFTRLRTIADERLRELYFREMGARLRRIGRSSWVAGRQKPAGRAPRPRGHGAGRPWRATEVPRSRGRLLETRLGRSKGPGERRHAEELCLALVLQHPQLAERHFEKLTTMVIGDPALDSLRTEILSAMGSTPDLDREGLRAHLKERGHDGAIRRLMHSDVIRSLRFMNASASEQEVERGWRQVIARLRCLALEEELKEAEERYGRELSDSALDRLLALREEMERAYAALLEDEDHGGRVA